jgi:DHA1 family multidrug resistance protein-like MFS transporter
MISPYIHDTITQMKPQIKVILFLSLMQGIAFNLAHPITPEFVKDLGIDPVYFGVFFSAMSLGSVFGSPFWGYRFDKGNVHIPFMIGTFMYALGQLAFAYSNDVYLMVLSRFFSGVGAVASTIVLSALIVSQSEKKHVALHLSLFAATSIIGSSLGYYLGGALSELIHFSYFNSYTYIFVFQSIFTLVFLLISYVLLKSLTFSMRQPKTFLSEIKSLTSMPKYQWFFFLAILSVTMSTMFLSRYVDVLFNERGYSPNVIGNYVLITGIVSVLTLLFLVPKIISFKPVLTLIVLLLVSAMSIFITFSMEAFLLSMYTFYMIFVIAKTAFQPIEHTYIANFGVDYGKLMGLRQFFISLGMVFGPLLLGILYDQFEMLAFFISGVLLIFGLLFIYLSYRTFLKIS